MLSADEVTRLLAEWGNGDPEAAASLMPLIYDELRRLASHFLRRERPDHTLQPTALVNELYLRLVEQRNVKWKNRANFFAVAAQLMRRLLVDHARRHHAAKRGGGNLKVSLDEALAVADRQDVEVLPLEEALESLTAIDPQQGRIVELRFYGGLTIEETAEVLGISAATVKREWTVARVWLYREIHRNSPSEA